jgi:hypothetical protein
MTTQQALTSAEWIAFFMHDDHEQDKATPGPYEQGSGILWRETLEEFELEEVKR